MSNPGSSHWQTLKWILRYLKGSLGRVLIYGGGTTENRQPRIEYFVENDYAGFLDTRKSLFKYIFTAFGIAVSWEAILQKL